MLYIGEATEAAGQSMDHMIQVEARRSSQLPTTIKHPEGFGREVDLNIEEGFRDILTRPYFQGALNLQDILNARFAVVQCGSQAVSSKIFVLTSKPWLDKSDGLSQQVLALMPGSREEGQPAPKYQLHDLLQRFQHSKVFHRFDKIYALLGMLDHKNLKTTILRDYTMSEKDLMLTVIANLCFYEFHCVPQPPYGTTDEFLLYLDPIDNSILEKTFESSRDIDLVSLLRYGSHYVEIDRSLVEAARRNSIKGREMVELPVKTMDQKRSAFPITYLRDGELPKDAFTTRVYDRLST